MVLAEHLAWYSTSILGKKSYVAHQTVVPNALQYVILEVRVKEYNKLGGQKPNEVFCSLYLGNG
jgi:hypothetical protein